MPILGVFPEYANNKKKAFGGIDRWIQSLFYREHSSTDEVVALVTSRIEVIVDKLGLETLYITGTGNSEDSEMVRNALVRMLREEGVSVSEGISVVQDSQSLKRMAEADGVIFVEKIGESRYDDLKEEGSICQSYQIPVLGCVVLR